MLWWGIYFGWFGVCLGAVLGASVEQIRARLSERSHAKAVQLEYARPTGVTTIPSKWVGPVTERDKLERDPNFPGSRWQSAATDLGSWLCAFTFRCSINPMSRSSFSMW